MISPINFNNRQMYQSFTSRKIETRNSSCKKPNYIPQRISAGMMAMLASVIFEYSKPQNPNADINKTCIIEEESTTNKTSTETKISNEHIKDELAQAIDKQLGKGFSAKVENVAKNINCNPNDLLALMYSESALNPSLCEDSGAVGLIQFIPETMDELGITSYELKNMSGIEQMDYVEKFFIQNKKIFLESSETKLDSGMLYTLCFLPAYTGQEILCEIGSDYYNENSGLDLNQDGAISKSDLEERISEKYSEMCEDFL